MTDSKGVNKESPNPSTKSSRYSENPVTDFSHPQRLRRTIIQNFLKYIEYLAFESTYIIRTDDIFNSLYSPLLFHQEFLLPIG